MSLNIFPQAICSGDIFPINLLFKNQSTGNPEDMTGSTVGVTVKSGELDESTVDDSDAVFQHDIAGDTTGKFTFYVGPLDAGDYWIDVKMWSGTARTTVLTPVQMHVLQGVTVRTTPVP